MVGGWKGGRVERKGVAGRGTGKHGVGQAAGWLQSGRGSRHSVVPCKAVPTARMPDCRHNQAAGTPPHPTPPQTDQTDPFHQAPHTCRVDVQLPCGGGYERAHAPHRKDAAPQECASGGGLGKQPARTHSRGEARQGVMRGRGRAWRLTSQYGEMLLSSAASAAGVVSACIRMSQRAARAGPMRGCPRTLFIMCLPIKYQKQKYLPLATPQLCSHL